MKNTKIILGGVVLGLMVFAAFSLNWVRSKQRIGSPGVIAEPTTNGLVMKVELPEKVLGFSSSNVPQSQIVTNMLPPDTSYAQRFYWTEDGFWANANIILMGRDRSSIHKADYCLAGQGFQTVKKETVTITVPGPVPYEMPIAKWTIRGIFPDASGQKREVHGIYSFWFVADGELTVDNTQRILWFYRDLLTRRVLQRWAYVSFQTYCNPGQEDAAFERMKQLILATIPEFQRPLAPATAVATRN